MEFLDEEVVGDDVQEQNEVVEVDDDEEDDVVELHEEEGEHDVVELDEVLDEAVKDLAADAQLQKAVNDMSILADAAQEQAQADAATMSAAAMAFAGKFRPENILDVKEEEDSVTISLRSDAFASGKTVRWPGAHFPGIRKGLLFRRRTRSLHD